MNQQPLRFYFKIILTRIKLIRTKNLDGTQPSLKRFYMFTLSRNFLPFTEHEDLLPCSQRIVTGPYPEPVKSSQNLHILLL